MLKEEVHHQNGKVPHGQSEIKPGKIYPVPMSRGRNIGRILRPILSVGLALSIYHGMSEFEKFHTTSQQSLAAASSNSLQTAINGLESLGKTQTNEGTAMADAAVEAIGCSAGLILLRRKRRQYLNSAELNALLSHSETNGDKVYRKSHDDKSRVLKLRGENTTRRGISLNVLSKAAVGAAALVLGGSLTSMVTETTTASTVTHAVDKAEFFHVPSFIINTAEEGYLKNLEEVFYNKHGAELGLTEGAFSKIFDKDSSAEEPGFDVATDLLGGVRDVSAVLAPQAWFGENGGNPNNSLWPYGFIDLAPMMVLGAYAFRRNQSAVLITENLITSSANTRLLAA